MKIHVEWGRRALDAPADVMVIAAYPYQEIDQTYGDFGIDDPMLKMKKVKFYKA